MISPGQPRSRWARRPAAFLTMLALVAGLVATAPRTDSGAAWLVQEGTPLPAGSVVLQSLPVADALVVAAPSRPEGAVAADTPLAWRSTGVVDPEAEPVEADDPAAPPGGSLAEDSPISWTGADDVWAGGEDGSRALVALIDTGVAPVEGLQDAVAGEIDFSGSGGGDGYGHGTFLASLIAARHDTVRGVAPGAGVLSLKVAGDDGGTDLGTVLGALQWLHGPGSQAGIRIAVLALGVDADSPAARVLDDATDRLAQKGMLVVAAAGNDGPEELSSPATARRTFSAGATDHRNTTVAPASFSGTGTDRAGAAQPDVYAPGVRVTGWVAPGSEIAEAHADLIEDGAWLRGTGTSMSAALTGGVAALASSARPDLDGHGLERALRAGDGRLDAAAAVAAAEAAPGRPGQVPAAAAGKAPATPPGLTPAPLPSIPAWGPASWESVRWVGGAWGSVRWVGTNWESVRWVGDRWESVRWVDEGWASVRWVDQSWASVRWVGESWGSVRWVGAAWER